MARKPFEKPVPGELFIWVKRVSWVELVVFMGLLFFWLVPGFETETMVFGWAHGLGFIALCLLMWVACIRKEAPYTLLAATVTPAGPIGSVIGIELIERKGWGVAEHPGSSTSAAKTAPEQG
ncbi:MAG TPA: hypothetical protein VLI94_06270 [Solirubrobacterales bacterium]|nr:hypothetical protein [Solirubrobacterales bacterium]